MTTSDAAPNRVPRTPAPLRKDLEAEAAPAVTVKTRGESTMFAPFILNERLEVPATEGVYETLY